MKLDQAEVVADPRAKLQALRAAAAERAQRAESARDAAAQDVA
jgi:hypothetical protein